MNIIHNSKLIKSGVYSSIVSSFIISILIMSNIFFPEEKNIESFDLFLPYFLFTLMVVFVSTVLFTLPAYIILKKMGNLNVFSIAFLGGGVAYLLDLLMFMAVNEIQFIFIWFGFLHSIIFYYIVTIISRES